MRLRLARGTSTSGGSYWEFNLPFPQGLDRYSYIQGGQREKNPVFHQNPGFFPFPVWHFVVFDREQ